MNLLETWSPLELILGSLILTAVGVVAIALMAVLIGRFSGSVRAGDDRRTMEVPGTLYCAAVIVVVISLASTLAAVTCAPFTSEGRESWLQLLAAGAIVAGVVLAVGVDPSTHKWVRAVVMPVMLLLVLVVFWSVTDRSYLYSRLMWQAHGAVIERYRSENHQVPSIRVRGPTGRVVTLEGIPLELWERVAVGSSFRKSRWCPDAIVDGRAYDVVGAGALASRSGCDATELDGVPGAPGP